VRNATHSIPDGSSSERNLSEPNNPTPTLFRGRLTFGFSLRILPLSILAVLAIVSMSPVAFASSSVPFNGSSTGTFAFTSPTTAALTGTGNYEHLGMTAFAAVATITGTAGCGGFTTTETDTYTAANGDEVLSSATLTICPTSTSGVFQSSGTFTVVGGTGRFAGASGSGALHALVTFTGQFSGSFSGTTTGTISY